MYLGRPEVRLTSPPPFNMWPLKKIKKLNPKSKRKKKNWAMFLSFYIQTNHQKIFLENFFKKKLLKISPNKKTSYVYLTELKFDLTSVNC
jgi:hypothetical protein